ncbi:MAG: septal ring lytic transglycosylase RlpA family protein [Oligoflexia bacterium]|nr:septal ring lytic transglycosylase RlpA family protein [Oligoflexia bacterium]
MKILKLIMFLMLIDPLLAEPLVEHGKASWYSVACNGGTKTASGIKLNNNSHTVAHKKLPMGTKVKITNMKNGKFEYAVVTDRGPYKKGRIVDVTVAIAEKLGFKQQGIATVKVEVVGKVK